MFWVWSMSWFDGQHLLSFFFSFFFLTYVLCLFVFCCLNAFFRPEPLRSRWPPSIHVCLLWPNESDYFQLHAACLMGGLPPTWRATGCALVVSFLMTERTCNQNNVKTILWVMSEIRYCVRRLRTVALRSSPCVRKFAHITNFCVCDL